MQSARWFIDTFVLMQFHRYLCVLLMCESKLMKPRCGLPTLTVITSLYSTSTMHTNRVSYADIFGNR